MPKPCLIPACAQAQPSCNSRPGRQTQKSLCGVNLGWGGGSSSSTQIVEACWRIPCPLARPNADRQLDPAHSGAIPSHFGHWQDKGKQRHPKHNSNCITTLEAQTWTMVKVSPLPGSIHTKPTLYCQCARKQKETKRFKRRLNMCTFVLTLTGSGLDSFPFSYISVDCKHFTTIDPK